MKKLLALILTVFLLCSCGQKTEKPSLDSGGPQFTITQKNGKQMPSFVYVGDNPSVAAICEWFSDEAERHASYGDVWIPSFVILEEVDRDGEHLVFGNFWSCGYRLEEDTMVQGGGGAMPACFHLKETENGYIVVSVDKAGDGEYYAESIKEFTKDYPELYNKFMNHHDNDQAEIEFMKMYAEYNGLNIRYIKHYGWDPISLY